MVVVDGPFIAHLESLHHGTLTAAFLIDCLSGCSSEHLMALVDE